MLPSEIKTEYIHNTSLINTDYV